MNKPRRLLLFTTVIVTLLLVRKSLAYMPENELVFHQICEDNRTQVGSDLEVAIIIKNYLNITITNITVSINITAIEALEFTGWEFNSTTDENGTLTSNIQSTTEYGFSPLNITGGKINRNFLSLNISNMINGTKLLFRYNLTSDTAGEYLIPLAKISYYDNWKDKQTAESSARIRIEFSEESEEWPEYLPRWDSGRELSKDWVIFIYYIAPIVTAVAVATIFSYIKKI